MVSVYVTEFFAAHKVDFAAGQNALPVSEMDVGKK